MCWTKRITVRYVPEGIRIQEQILHFQAIAAQLEFLAWRDAQLSAISLQLEEAFPALTDALDEEVGRIGTLNLVRSSIAVRSSAEALIRRWGNAQLEAALERAEAELDQTILHLPHDMDLEGDIRDQVTKALPAMAGIGLIGASVAAIPTVISFATVGTGALAIFGVASISWPLFALGAAGIGIATLAGSHSLKLAESKARTILRRRMLREAERQVFGIGAPAGARCISSDIQAAVIRAGQNRIQGVG